MTLSVTGIQAPQLTLNTDGSLVVINTNNGTYGSYVKMTAAGGITASGYFQQSAPDAQMYSSPNGNGGYVYLYSNNSIVTLDSQFTYKGQQLMPDVVLDGANFLEYRAPMDTDASTGAMYVGSYGGYIVKADAAGREISVK